MKYRLLTAGELKELEPEFVNYLVVNGIVADDWQRMKEKEPEKAKRIIDLFSDVVFESIFRKAQFLEYVGENEIRTFQCLDEKIVLVGLTCTAPGVDLRTDDLSTLTNAKVYTTEKKYGKKRQEELFDMVNAGCVISNGDLFKQISLLL